MRDAEQTKQFTRRAIVIGGGQFLLSLVLVGRIAYLQVIEAKKYKKLSDNNYLKIKLLAPSRGKIFDCQKQILADNIDSYNVVLIPEESFEKITKEEFLDSVSKIIELTDKEKERILRDIKRTRKFSPILVKDHLTWDEMSKIQAKNLDFPGTYIETGELRIYPKEKSCAHVIGYVGRVSERDLKEDSDPLLSIPNFRVGKTGFEKALEKQLRGERGEVIQIVNSTGRVVETLNNRTKKPTDGKDIQLTIDSRLQEYAQEVLSREESASAVLMDIYTGEVLCMSSYPSFDPNIFNTKPDDAEFERLFSSNRFPFMNKSIEGLYAPGSTFKMMGVLAGLESGEITQNTTINCSGHMDYANHRYHCWRNVGHGPVNAINSLRWSCDIYFYELVLKIGFERVKEMALKFGLGQKTGIPLSNEKAGQIPGRDWKRKERGEAWYHGDSIGSIIGQGYILTTPIQLAVMTARIANGGYAVKPTLFKDPNDTRILRKENKLSSSDIEFNSIGIDPYHLSVVQKGMYAVVNAQYSTGNSAYINYKGQRMAGKTGTAQVARITMEERAQGIRSQYSIPWNRRHHALFVGYAPYNNPRFAISVVAEHGVSGGVVTAPMGRDIMLRALELYS